MGFSWDLLSANDRALAYSILRDWRNPDIVIAPDGSPYLYRWHLVPRGDKANAYLHLQVASDPDRSLHDHPYDNQSVILAGAYREVIQEHPPYGTVRTLERRGGQTIHRRAETAHRLILPSDVPYTMTLFTTGPRIREWGFWTPKRDHTSRPAEWNAWTDITRQLEDGRWVHNELV